MITMTLSMLLIPLGFFFVAAMTVSGVRRLCSASEPCERMYWGVNTFARVMIAYGFVVLGLMMFDSLYGDTLEIARPWPSLSRHVDIGQDYVPVLIDVAAVLVVALGLTCAARGFGRVDENDAWLPPVWLVRRRERRRG